VTSSVILEAPPATRRESRQRSRPPVVLLVLGILVATASLLPLGFVVVSAIDLGPTQAWELLTRPRFGELLGNTVRLLVGAVALSTVWGVGLAWLVVRTDLPLARFWHGALCAPLAVPAFVNGYGWVSTTHAVQSYWGAVLIVSLSYYPLVYLPTVAALSRLDSTVEEVAAGLGATAWSSFRRVVLPAIAPAVFGGALLVGLHLLGEYGALQLLNYPTLTTAILEQYRLSFNGPAATMLALVLVALCLLLLRLEASARGNRPRSRVGSGVRRTAARLPLGRWKAVWFAAVLTFVLVDLGVPLTSLARWLVKGSSSSSTSVDLLAPLSTTLVLAALSGVLTAIAAAPLAWLAVRHRGFVTNVLERTVYPANALPGIVVGLALVTISIRVVPALYQTMPVLVLGYVILFLPRAAVGLRSTLELAPPVLEDVATTLGCTRTAAARRVTLPLVLPGLAAGGALVSLAVGTELTATLLLAPTGSSTLATEFWSHAAAVEYGAAAPSALALILLSVPATWLLGRTAVSQSSRRLA
jgi:iron(III) transport system permease protein